MRSLLRLSLGARRHRRAIAAGLAEVDHRHAELVDRAKLNKSVSRGDALKSERCVYSVSFVAKASSASRQGADEASGADEVFDLALAAARRATNPKA